MAPLIYVNDHGFWELRFSVAYRALFDETPSETLRRAAQRRSDLQPLNALMNRREDA
jgi:hypothetical protein